MNFPKFHLGSITKYFMGRSTFFAVFFALTAFILALLGKLTDSYAAVITALQAFVLLHSAKEDQNGNTTPN